MSRPIPVILSACRTPIGRYLGGLSGRSAVDLGVVAAKEALARSQVDPDQVDEAIVGNVLAAGLGQAPARQVAIGAGIPTKASALTINMVCGSGLRSVMLAATAIRAGDADVVLAGGMESMSNAPHLLRGGRSGWKLGDGVLVDSMLHDGLTCAVEGWPMGEAAERTADMCKLSREELDSFSCESHRRALEAQRSGAFDLEIVPVTIEGKKGVSTTIKGDEGPRAESDQAALARLKPAFCAEGVVTAGNSSSLSDGAAMLVVASEAKAEQLRVRPVARILATAISGLDPCDLFLAPIGAIRAVLAKARLTPQDVDLYEINEAFASQLLGCVKGLEIDLAKVNVHGGAIALGHPIGASGARVLVTLVHALERHGKKIGVAALCLGGGNAVALVVERA
ncbi:acetyl-CoA C-acetyltransferase [Singulisphaera sp. GP187]|uniref:acetyl-CoA C-acetyltransferase n=1 Tax=Singulisphaera sp. GP187 TaxID=1882752 RepID=UPI00092C3D9A|nr:acetyl-CoA C-acetyltransferase [Singulisphaera sp. GP187]SIO02210.1 acetyl-CoA C-acetyltransferase [Singulisphaera sp. GP187]